MVLPYRDSCRPSESILRETCLARGCALSVLLVECGCPAWPWEGQTKNLTGAPFCATYRTGDKVVWVEKLTDARFTLDTICPSCGAALTPRAGAKAEVIRARDASCCRGMTWVVDDGPRVTTRVRAELSTSILMSDMVESARL